jgi:hypothetical protein
MLMHVMNGPQAWGGARFGFLFLFIRIRAIAVGILRIMPGGSIASSPFASLVYWDQSGAGGERKDFLPLGVSATL